jgi:hypothetical protein
MNDKEFLVLQLMSLGYSQAEAEAIVARNAIASELVRQGMPLERALSIANNIVGSVAGTADMSDSLSTQADVATFAQGMQAQRGDAPLGTAPVGPVTASPLGPPSEAPVTTGVAPAVPTVAPTPTQTVAARFPHRKFRPSPQRLPISLARQCRPWRT